MFRLALAVGEWDVYRMMEEMPSSLMAKWVEYARVEPFGQPWENWLMAVPAHQFGAAHTGKNQKPPKFSDYVYEDAENRRQREAKQLFNFFESKVKDAK